MADVEFVEDENLEVNDDDVVVIDDTWDRMIPINDGWNREEYWRHILRSKRANRFKDSLHLMIRASEVLGFDFNDLERDAFYWCWTALIAERHNARDIGLYAEREAMNENDDAGIKSAIFYKNTISFEIFRICRRINEFCVQILESPFCVLNESKLFYNMMKAEVSWKLGLALDGEVEFDAEGHTKHSCIANAMRFFTDALVFAKLLTHTQTMRIHFYYSYTNFLGKDGTADSIREAKRLARMVENDVKYEHTKGIDPDNLGKDLILKMKKNSTKWGAGDS